MHQNVCLNCLQPGEHVLLDCFNSKEHREAFLIVVEQLMEVNSDHKHGTVISFLAEFLYNILVDMILNPLDQGHDILLVLRSQVPVEHLWLILLVHCFVDFRHLQEAGLLNGLGQLLHIPDGRCALLRSHQILDVEVYLQKFSVKLELLEDSRLAECIIDRDFSALLADFCDEEHV